MRNILENYFEKTFFHVLRQTNRNFTQALSMSVWHTKHHFQYIIVALSMLDLTL